MRALLPLALVAGLVTGFLADRHAAPAAPTSTISPAHAISDED